ncbi:MAG: SDR family oxidoreductase [Halioglobus sp.]
MFSVQGKHTFITGGSSGIGLEIVRLFRQGGATVCVFDLQANEELEQLGVEFVQGSVTDESVLANALLETTQRHGPLDVLINNAGISMEEGAICDTNANTFQQVLQVNLYGVLYGLKHGGPLVRDGGSIINTASLAAQASMPEYTGYSVSKAGVVKLTQQAALELGSRQIRVNAVCPGTTVTPMEPADSDETRLCQVACALGRPARAEEQAAMYYFLASDESSYISGQAINVDGGWLHGMTYAMSSTLLT